MSKTVQENLKSPHAAPTKPTRGRAVHLRIEMQIFSLHWMMQNIRL